MYYVYILRSLSSNIYYTGIAKDVDALTKALNKLMKKLDYFLSPFITEFKVTY